MQIRATHETALDQKKSLRDSGLEIVAEGRLLEALKQTVKVAWVKWRELTGVICDREIPMWVKSKLYETVVRPVLLDGSECWAVGKKEEELIGIMEMRMLGGLRE